MKYRLPDETIIDLGKYTLDDCEEIESESEVLSQDEIFNKTGILIAVTKGK